MEPGRQIAAGRDGAIYEFGPGLVLRKTFDGRSIAGEARLIEYLAERGYPVPRVHEVRNDGTEIVMERLDGPMMMDTLARRPWTLPRGARQLADLHDRLHDITAPDWLRPLAPDGDRVLHLDLHPMNVMMTARGPVVVDWAGAARGDPLTDVALTYVDLVAPRMPAPALVRWVLHPARIGLGRAFLRRYRGPELRDRVAYAAELKSLDRNLDASETARCGRIARRWRR